MADSAPGPLIGSGRNADVFGIGGDRVLRRYRDGRAPLAVAREAEVMTHARAHGVPVPEVFDVSGSDIVMGHAAGPTMLDTLARRPWTVRSQASLLARLHAVVHSAPALGWLVTPFGDGAGSDRAEGDVLLHRDLHPMNVILTALGPMIIDWEGAARGPAMADIAMTWVIVAFSEVPGPWLRAAAAKGVQTTRAGLKSPSGIGSWTATCCPLRKHDSNACSVTGDLLGLGRREGPFGITRAGHQRRPDGLCTAVIDRSFYPVLPSV